MTPNEPNKSKEAILRYLVANSPATVEEIAVAVSLSPHGCAMCCLRAKRQFLIRKVDAKEDSQQFPQKLEITDKGTDRLRFYESQTRQEARAR